MERFHIEDLENKATFKSVKNMLSSLDQQLIK